MGATALKFNHSLLEALEDLGEYRDTSCEGLYMRIGKRKRVFFHRYRVNGIQDRCNVGIFPEISYKEARKIIQENRNLIDDNINPKHYRRPIDGQTFGDVVGEILTNLKNTAVKMESKNKIPKVSLRTLELYQNLFDHCTPLYPLEMDKINRPLIQSLLDKIESESGPTHAHNARKFIHNMYERAIGKGKINREDNPAKRTVVELPKTPDQTGAGALKREHIAELWIRSALLKNIQRTLVRTTLLTGLRISNVCQMRYDQIEDGVLEIPAHKFKGKRVFVVPLSAQLDSLIKDHQKAMREEWSKHYHNNPQIFPSNSPTCKNPHVHRSSTRNSFKIVDGGDVSYSSHSMRKTMDTELSRIGCTEEIIEQMIGHQKASLKRRYNKNEYFAQKQEWFQTWADMVDDIVVEWKANNPTGVEDIWQEWEAENNRRHKHKRKDPKRIRQIYETYI